jgi:2-keto-4-pentenoate hydratase
VKKRRRREYLKKRNKLRVRRAIQASIDRAEFVLSGQAVSGNITFADRIGQEMAAVFRDEMAKTRVTLLHAYSSGDTFAFEMEVTIYET